MELTGAQIVIECLKEQGVDTVFGFPGGAILNVYDELYKHRDEITHYLTSHEQGASHAADGYARATGKVGVCFATSGPGATNMVTGIATAYMDSIPVVMITCNVGLNLLGKDSFQEIDILGITMPVTKYNFIVKDVTKLADVIRRAFRIAQTGRPGPVVIDITKNVTATKTEYTYKKPEPILPDASVINEIDVEKAVTMIAHSKRPFVFVGGGVTLANASEELRRFVKKIDAPVADSLMGKGAFDGTSDAYVGMLGMHGTKAANYGLNQSDLIIVVGSRFSDRVIGNPKTFGNKAQILQIDVDASEINKNIVVTHCIAGDAKLVLRKLSAQLNQMEHNEWMQYINELKTRYPLTYPKDRLTGPQIVETIYEMTHGDAVICTEVGQHQMWAAQFYKYDAPRKFISSGGLGTMGYGLGASIGAKVACPEKTVINIAGDGCFRMNFNELLTASKYNIPIIEVIFNNSVLGMVRQWQTLFYERRYSSTILDGDFDYARIAEACGCRGMNVTNKEELTEALKEALSADGPVVINCFIDCDDKVWPMVAPGASISEAFSEEDMIRK
ncbi:biosynthetic-type acetolactate synthase large subunit [Frisingicoccus caecimuris]|uniref:Acetolactate synthase n=1 Tax=Frisingicoccus caecimuris TaxID=1796636 RepID=A0A4R2LBB4_9FIRM|nr:biosynthetic-type acetolactate synthase large subunit [Frisingicoccus caecimuris]MCR1919014.1 biosynthetic-type acetolactate synthase large subunit [Frisingicoccus caecimuris]TCO84791.1 acetolactate synthase large subunit [Frisingicoccus caecimuris]